MKQRKLERTQYPATLRRRGSTDSQRPSQQAISYTDPKMTRSQAVFSSRSKTALPYCTSSSLGRLPARARVRPCSERLARWMERSSCVVDPLHMSQQIRGSDRASTNSCSSSVSNSATLGKSNKASLLRSKTCPLPLPQSSHTEIYKKQKMFTHRCKAYSASSVSSHTLPNGETLHGFLTGARYNRAFTLDAHSRDKFGVYVLKRDISKTFTNQPSRPISHKIYDNCQKTRVSQMESQLLLAEGINGFNIQPSPPVPEHEFEAIRAQDSAASIERQLEEVFGPNQDDSCCSGSSKSEIEKTSDNRSQSQNNSLASSSQQFDNEDNEEDFISHEAQKLTQKILEECHDSSSSLESIDSISQTTEDAKSTDYCMGKDKLLQTSFENLNRDHQTLPSDHLNSCVTETAQSSHIKRVASARPSTIKSRQTFLPLSTRPKSAGPYLEPRTSTSLFIDMSSLQQPTKQDTINEI